MHGSFNPLLYYAGTSPRVATEGFRSGSPVRNHRCGQACPGLCLGIHGTLVVSFRPAEYNTNMRNLSVCLREYPLVFLQALTRIWALEEPASSRSELAEQLSSAMLRPRVVHPILEELPPEAREALACVVANGGAVRGYLLTRRYGNIRPLGPNPLLRLQPWSNPDSPLEALYYRGLLYRTYDALGDYRGEVLFLPPQLVAVLPPMEYTAPPFSVLSTSCPAFQQLDGDALGMDVFTVLTYVRRETMRSTRGPFLDARAIAALAPRLRGEADNERLHLIQRLMRAAKLVVDERGLVKPGPQAREWLRSDPYHRSEVLFQAWRSDKGGHELHSVNGLRWESTGRPHDASAPREAILSHLTRCPPETWISLPSFIGALKLTDPDFLRPNGDYDSWYIQDVAAKRFLTGFESWDQVEGQLIAHIILRPLRWLGALAIGQMDGEATQISFRLSPMGLALLGPRAPEPAAEESGTFVVGQDLVVRVPPNANLYDRYQLERFSEWRGEEDGMLLHRLTRSSVWRGQDQGIEIRQLIAFLRRASGEHLPNEAVRTLTQWGNRHGKVVLREAILLQTPDEATMHDLREHPALAESLGEQLSPHTVLVTERNLDLVARKLKQIGHWPRVEAEGGKRREKGE